jgi:hypothetical protein
MLIECAFESRWSVIYLEVTAVSTWHLPRFAKPNRDERIRSDPRLRFSHEGVRSGQMKTERTKTIFFVHLCTILLSMILPPVSSRET